MAKIRTGFYDPKAELIKQIQEKNEEKKRVRIDERTWLLVTKKELEEIGAEQIRKNFFTYRDGIAKWGAKWRKS